jgi:hypothetical protein
MSDALRHVRRSSGRQGREILSLHRPTRIYDHSSLGGQTTVGAIAIFVREQHGHAIEWRVELTSAALPKASRIESFATRAEALGYWEALP